jgi:hypothetical protein
MVYASQKAMAAKFRPNKQRASVGAAPRLLASMPLLTIYHAIQRGRRFGRIRISLKPTILLVKPQGKNPCHGQTWELSATIQQPIVWLWLTSAIGRKMLTIWA